MNELVAGVCFVLFAAGSLAAQSGPAGDAARGRALVERQECLTCHRIADKGSYLGPDLTDIGDRRDPAELERALVAPDEEVLPENRFIRAVTKQGAIVTGRLLNQDGLSVQFMDEKDQLRTLMKADLREFGLVDKGLMPSVEGQLSAQQIADIVSYTSAHK